MPKSKKASDENPVKGWWWELCHGTKLNTKVCERCSEFIMVMRGEDESRQEIVVCKCQSESHPERRMVLSNSNVPSWCSCILEHSLIEWSK